MRFNATIFSCGTVALVGHLLPGIACALISASASAETAATDSTANTPAPYSVREGLFRPGLKNLGLMPAPGTQTITVFRPASQGNDKEVMEQIAGQFNNGVVLIAFKDMLYAQWQTSPRDEDSPDTQVVFSRSADGVQWSVPQRLAGAGAGSRMHSSGGWWTDGRTLIAYINVWPTGFQSRAGGFTEYSQSSDGLHWSPRAPVTGADNKPVPGIIEQDPHALPGGRVLTAFHVQPGLQVAPFYTDDPLGIRGWTRGAFTARPHENNASRELEPSLFLRGDCAVMVFRDQASSFRQLASESCDRGLTWREVVTTNMPDSRSKQSAGNLPDGTAFLVNAPNADRVRMPLAVTLSRDGRDFDRSFLLRGEDTLQPLRQPGLYKRPGYHYPKSVVWKGHLYVGYATNKEDVEVTRVPLQALAATAKGEAIQSPRR